MNQKVLVAYATKYGATEEIAERIGLALGNAGVAAEVLAVDKVEDVTAYAAVVWAVRSISAAGARRRPSF